MTISSSGMTFLGQISSGGKKPEVPIFDRKKVINISIYTSSRTETTLHMAPTVHITSTSFERIIQIIECKYHGYPERKAGITKRLPSYQDL